MQFVQRTRPSQQKTLEPRAARLAQQGELLLGLDPFGDHINGQ